VLPSNSPKRKPLDLKNVRYIQGDLLAQGANSRYDLLITLAGIPTGTTAITGKLVDKAIGLLNPSGVLLGYAPSGLAGERTDGDSRLGLVYNNGYRRVRAVRRRLERNLAKRPVRGLPVRRQG